MVVEREGLSKLISAWRYLLLLSYALRAIFYHKVTAKDASDANSLLTNVSTSNQCCVCCYSACLIGVLVSDSG